MNNPSPLHAHPVIAFVPTVDPDRAKAFYQDVLGFEMTENALPFALVFDMNGTMLRLTVVRELNPVHWTILGWKTLDIEATAAALRAAGVPFMTVPGLPQDEHGIWTTPGGSKVAWFKDPDGNTLSISQH